MSARTVDGGALRILNVMDEHTREAHESKVARSIGSESVRKQLEKLFAAHGKPKYLRADNGREFISEALKTWLPAQGVTPIFIAKASPQQNCYIERFNGSMRRELLNGEQFHSVLEAKVVIAEWLVLYNTRRPHRGLGGRTYWTYTEPDADRIVADEDDDVAWSALLLDGQARGSSWTPPNVRVINISGQVQGSFMPWLSRATLILRDEAIDTVGGILAGYGELLPLRCATAELVAFNALVVTDALDEEVSRIHTWSSGNVSVETAVFSAGVDALGIFKWSKNLPGPIYFSQAVVDRITSTGSTSGTGFRPSDRELLWYCRGLGTEPPRIQWRACSPAPAVPVTVD